MPSQRGTLELIAEGLGHVVEPITARLERGETRYMIAELGLDIPNDSATQDLENAFQSIVHAGELLPGLINELIAAVDAGDEAQSITKGVQLIQQFAAIGQGVATLGNTIPTLNIPTLTPAELSTFVQGLPKKMTEMMMVEFLQGSVAHGLLSLLGIFEVTRGNVGHPSPQMMEFDQKRLRLDRVETLLTDPEQLMRDLYGWGDAGFDGNLLVNRVAHTLKGFGVPVARSVLTETPPRNVVELSVFSLRPTTAMTPPGLEFTVMDDISDGLEVSLPFAPGFELEFEARGDLQAGAGLTIQPPAKVEIVPLSGEAHGRLSTRIAAAPEPPRDDITILSISGIGGLFAKRIAAGIVTGFEWDSSSGKATGDFGVEGEVSGGELRIGMDDADGFIADLMSGVALQAQFDFGIGWSAGEGVYFTGGGGLSIQLPAHIDVGPVDLSAITLTVGIEGASFPIAITVDMGAELGPLSAVVEQIGTEMTLAIAPDQDGNLGFLDLDGAFKPPVGVGLALDAGPVKGGGYVRFDPPNGEYAGALELDLAGIVTVKAITVINTKMPDGSKGFSMITVITAEFGTGIQLGFGFVLLGVGGILGVHRTMNLDALVEGVRTGSIDRVMFPMNVIENAPRIISDLKAYFPIEQDTFLIGPLAKLGWGTPSLVTLSLGVVIEIPGNIAILGVLKVELPDEDAALLVLQVSFIGAIEFDKDRAWFFASLFGSRVLFITIEGDMGLLIGWGKDANFVISVGGFHPSYQPPPMPFPVPLRLSVMILNESWGRIRVYGYFAVTSNTVQFGAGIELYFGFSAFSIQGDLSFDALFQFSPFFFIVQISGSLALKAGGIDLLSVHLKFALEGPTPWRAKGRGKVKILFFSISANFDVSWGEEADTKLPPVDVMPILEAEFNKLENWTTELPAAHSLSVSLTPLPPDQGLVLHPIGTLRISQRAVPLDIDIDKVGNQSASDAKRFSLVDTSGDFVCKFDAEEMFARGQYIEMEEGARLSSKDFQSETSGCVMAAEGDDLGLTRAATRNVRYELIIIDNNHERFRRGFLGILQRIFNVLLGGNAMAKAEVSFANAKKMQPFDEKVEVTQGGYTVTFANTNQPVSADATFGSEAKARAFMADHIAANPTQAGSVQVIEAFEMDMAA